jgi:type IV secretion system protein VirB6
MADLIWFGGLIDGMLNGYIQAVLARIIPFVIAMTALLVTLWGFVQGVAIMNEQVATPARTIIWKAFQMAIYVSIATTVYTYTDKVVDSVYSLSDGVLAAFKPAGAALDNAATGWQVLDQFAQQAARLVTEPLKNADSIMSTLVAGFAAMWFMIAAGLVEMVAVVCLCVTRVTLAFALSIGPIFIVSLMFSSTKQYFFNWVGLVVSAIILNWLVFFVLGVVITAAIQMSSMALADLNTYNPVGVAFVYLVACGAGAILLFLSPRVASSLSGGSPLDLGMAMITQAAIAMRVLGGGKAPEPKAGDNSVQQSPGLAHAASAGAQALYQRIADIGRSMR